MDKQAVVEFFDRCAPDWDRSLVRNETVIRRILDNGGIIAGIDVLDVACGTGVLFHDYLSRGVRSITGIDISSEMIRCAREKFPQQNIRLLCGDAETAHFAQQFDAVMLYNASPHFPDLALLIRSLAAALRPAGRLSIAHGMSRACLDRHHAGTAQAVSKGLLDAPSMAALFAPLFDVDVMISDGQMYQVSGRLR